MRVSCFTILLALAWLGSVGSTRAEIISGKPELGAATLSFSPREIDLDGDGLIDIELTSRTRITLDEPSSTSATEITARALGSNLILNKQHQPRRFEQVDRSDFAMASLGTLHWENGRASMAYFTRPQANPEAWDGGPRGFMLVLVGKADGYYPGWIQLDLGASPDGLEPIQLPPRIIDWHYDTEAIHVDPRHLQPRLQQLDLPKPFQQTLYVDRLIDGHHYAVEWSPVLTAEAWQVVEEFKASGTSQAIWWNVARSEDTRFFRIRYDGLIPE
jgi:hypothetical protein